MKIKTDRLILREWTSKDVNDLVEGLNDLEVSKWLVLVKHPYTRKDAVNWIKFCKKQARKKNRDWYAFAIELKSEKKVIGAVDLSKINKSQGTASGGLWINRKYHGHGYGSEAFAARIDFAFNELKLRRLENGYLKGNESSAKMQKKLGYKIEGLRRKGFISLTDGKPKDEITTALLKENWKKTT